MRRHPKCTRSFLILLYYTCDLHNYIHMYIHSPRIIIRYVLGSECRPHSAIWTGGAVPVSTVSHARCTAP